MIELEDCVLIESDIDAGGGAMLDLYFDPVNGLIVEDKTTSDEIHHYTEMPVGSVMDDLTDKQVIAIAEIVLRYCSRENEERPMTENYKQAFDKLVAEVHYDYYDFPEIKEAIEDYYYPR